jgi:hypothetical protein
MLIDIPTPHSGYVVSRIVACDTHANWFHESIGAECVGKATDAGGNGRRSVGLFAVFSWNPYC